jgi:hypothetical protein
MVETGDMRRDGETHGSTSEMHAYDRTLLARLGFDDPDKRDMKHDLACQYLVQPATLGRLTAAILHPLIAQRGDTLRFERPGREGVFEGRVETDLQKIAVGPAILEHPINKGENQYKTTIGFLDVVVPITYKKRYVGQQITKEYGDDADGKCRWHDARKSVDQTEDFCTAFLIEVKASPLRVGELIRQINLYREYPVVLPSHNLRLGREGKMQPSPLEHSIWVLASTHPVSDLDTATLKSSNIYHVALGESFERWVVEQERQKTQMYSGEDSADGLPPIVL